MSRPETELVIQIQFKISKKRHWLQANRHILYLHWVRPMLWLELRALRLFWSNRLSMRCLAEKLRRNVSKVYSRESLLVCGKWTRSISQQMPVVYNISRLVVYKRIRYIQSSCMEWTSQIKSTAVMDRWSTVYKRDLLTCVSNVHWFWWLLNFTLAAQQGHLETV